MRFDLTYGNGVKLKFLPVGVVAGLFTGGPSGTGGPRVLTPARWSISSNGALKRQTD